MKTTTERVQALDAALLASCGRVLHRVRLSVDAVGAPLALAAQAGRERAAIESSLNERAKSIK